MCWAYLYAETSALCKLLSLTIAYFADDTLTGNWYPPKTVSKLTDRKWFSFSVSHEDNPVWWMFYHAELNSQLLGSSSSFLSPLYLHGRQRSKVYVQICVNALMLYSWPSARQRAWTGITPCSQLLIWILKLAEPESESWVSFYAALWRTIMKESDFFFFFKWKTNQKKNQKLILWFVWLVCSELVCVSVKWVYFILAARVAQ